jgi:ketosteroid isomerase-like protein
MKTTREVLENHLMCFGKGDVNGILSDYAPKAILFTSAGPLVGADSMRPLYEGLIAEFAKPGSSFELKHQTIEGEYAYIIWTAETADNRYELSTDTFVVKDGKIVAQSFAAKIVPKA